MPSSGSGVMLRLTVSAPGLLKSGNRVNVRNF
jgi:hypothetical protein